jgi:antitoxin (DNA-binding transcriptional repressor) of toxin-antitoxin stability system
MSKTVIHVSDVEAANDFGSVLARVRAGADVVIEHDETPIAVVRPAPPVRRTIADCIALMPSDSTGSIDSDFASDVAAAVNSHPESLTPPDED